MHATIARLRSRLLRQQTGDARECRPTAPEACSWDAMRAVYEEQAARGVPEAVRGLELIDQGCWPSSGAPRDRRSRKADG